MSSSSIRVSETIELLFLFSSENNLNYSNVKKTIFYTLI